MTQNNLGLAWNELPTGDRAKNLENAIACYTRALKVFTKADFPVDWAGTQNNLGLAWGDLPTGDRAKNLENAIACYTRALEVYTQADFPPTGDDAEQPWHRVGATSHGRPCEESRKRHRLLPPGAGGPHPGRFPRRMGGYAEQPRCRMAGSSNRRPCEESRKRHRLLPPAGGRTQAGLPADWAATQNNLGNVFADLASSAESAGGAGPLRLAAEGNRVQQGGADGLHARGLSAQAREHDEEPEHRSPGV